MLVKKLFLALFLLLLSGPVVAGVVENSEEILKSIVPDNPDTQVIFTSPAAPTDVSKLPSSAPKPNSDLVRPDTPKGSSSKSGNSAPKATKTAPQDNAKSPVAKTNKSTGQQQDDNFSKAAILLILVLIGAATIYSRVASSRDED